MATSHLASQCTHSGGGICMVQVPDQGIEEETRSVTALLERLRRVFEGSRVRLLGSIDALLIARNLVSKPSWACAIYVTIISRSWMCQCGLCEDLKGRSSTVGYRQLGIVHGYRARAEAQGPAKLGQGHPSSPVTPDADADVMVNNRIPVSILYDLSECDICPLISVPEKAWLTAPTS